jgi:hypothetical protein
MFIAVHYRTNHNHPVIFYFNGLHCLNGLGRLKLVPEFRGSGEVNVVCPIVAQTIFDIRLDRHAKFAERFCLIVRNAHKIKIQRMGNDLPVRPALAGEYGGRWKPESPSF